MASEPLQPDRTLELRRSRWRDIRIDPVLLTFVVLAVVWTLALIDIEGYRTLNANLRFIRFASILAIVGIGQTFVVLMGGIDLSVAAVIGLAGVVGGNLISQHGQVAGILMTLAIVFAVGMLNGLGVVLLRLPPLVMTLGLSHHRWLVTGLQLGQPGERQITLPERLALGSTWKIPNTAIAALVIAGLGMILLHLTSYGRGVYAIGVNARASLLAGVPVDVTQVITYGICSLSAGIVGLILLGQTGYSFQDMGTPYLLQSIAVVVIGGTSILGGRGKLIGTLGGAMVMVVLVSWLTALRTTDAERQMIQGTLILILLIAYAFTDETR